MSVTDDAGSDLDHAEVASDETPTDPAEPLAFRVFLGVLAVAFIGYLVVGRDQWFFQDEWAFLVDRDAGNLHDLFQPHVVHWSTLPILVMRGMWQLVGLRTYVPYQAVIISLHLTTAVLLRAVMRRAEVRPWMATLAASIFVCFGAGNSNILWAAQIGYASALVLGLAQLLAADHDGPLDRRDWWGLVAGAAGLMASGVSVSLIIVVGMATLLRRGRRIAAFHTVPLAGLYLVWWALAGRVADTPAQVAIGPVVRFVVTGASTTIIAFGRLHPIAIGLVAILVVGLGVAWADRPVAVLRVRAALPAALLVGAGLFLVISGIGRAVEFGPDFAKKSRYLHITAAMLMPALAVAADALARRWRLLTPVVVAVLIAGVPGNLRLAENRPQARLGDETFVRALFAEPAVRTVPADTVPTWVEPAVTRRITAGWMRDVIASDRAPSSGDPTAEVRATARLGMSVQPAPGPPDAASTCRAITGTVTRTLGTGDRIALRGPARLWLVTDDATTSRRVPNNELESPILETVAGPVTLGFAPSGDHAAELCR